MTVSHRATDHMPGVFPGGHGIPKGCPVMPSLLFLTIEEEKGLGRALLAFGYLAW